MKVECDNDDGNDSDEDTVGRKSIHDEDEEEKSFTTSINIVCYFNCFCCVTK